MSKLLRRYLKEQNVEQGAAIDQAFRRMAPDIVRRAAAESGIDFDKLPPEIQTKVSDIVTRWGQNQTTYKLLSDQEAGLVTQIDTLANQPDSPDKQAILNQLNNQLVSIRSGLNQVKAGNAEIEAIGKELEPVVTQLRDTGQAAMAPPAQTPETPPPANDAAPAPAQQTQSVNEPVQPMPAPEGAPPPANAMAPEPQFKEPGPSQAPPEMHQGTLQNIPQMLVPAHQPAPEPGVFSQALTKAGEIGGSVKDWAMKQVTPAPPKGVAPPSLEPQFQEPGPSQAPPPVDVSKISVPAHGTSYQSAPPPPPPPTEPQFQEPGPSQAPEGAEGGMGDVAAGAAAVGIAGAAVMGAYKIYKQFFSKAARACANAPSKEECMQSYRDHGVQAAVNNLKKQIPRCGNDQDCAQKIQMAVQKLESKLGA